MPRRYSPTTTLQFYKAVVPELVKQLLNAVYFYEGNAKKNEYFSA
jgi:hypothetical protein